MRRYLGSTASKVIFPLGGIGTGCIGYTGTGRLVDWEIANRPNKLSYNGCSHLAIRAEADGQVLDARILAGPFSGELMGRRNYLTSEDMFGFGAPRETLGGAPCFAQAEFEVRFPFARLRLSDPSFPGRVTVTAFNPFIPLNPDDSSLPGALFQVEVENTCERNIRYTVVLVANNPWEGQQLNQSASEGICHWINLTNGEGKDTVNELCIATDEGQVSLQENWFRGSWFDGLGVYFRELRTHGNFPSRSLGITDQQRAPGGLPSAHGHATLAAHKDVANGATATIRMAVTWRVPECHNYWDDRLATEDLPAKGIRNSWKNYYAVRFASAADVAKYMLGEYERLYGDSLAFSQAFYDSTIPEVFIETAGDNLSVLKTPTCMRLEDGSFYGFEGCAPQHGCCEGSCSHVWNYAYALPYLFPTLERSMRDLEYGYNLQKSGEMTMRLMLPLGREARFRACADGQFGTILKVYREWKLSGDDQWLREIWPKVRRSLEYTWSPENMDRWDPEQSGLLTGRQHHTLDMELFGENAWLSGFYLAALEASARMAEFCGDEANARLYRQIYQRGRVKLNQQLFNGEYFCQQVELSRRELLEPYAKDNTGMDKTCPVSIYESYWDDEHQELKYQIGDGCGIDQMLGQWHATLLGLGEIFDEPKAISALKALFRWNFKERIGEIFNPCRLFSLGDESGTMICEWPTGRRKPWIPLTYAEETMPGMEYALAGQMIQRGLISQATKIVTAVRNRHTGENRNPWNEMECGSNYARSMASYAFLPAFSGFVCDASRKELTFNPHFEGGEFRCFWSMGTAWGSVQCTKSQVQLRVLYGTLELRVLHLPFFQAKRVEFPETRLFKRGEELVVEDVAI